MDGCVQLRWQWPENGIPVRRAEEEGFEVMVTTTQCTRHQQDPTGGNLGPLVLMSTALPRVWHQAKEICAANEEARLGQLREVSI